MRRRFINFVLVAAIATALLFTRGVFAQTDSIESISFKFDKETQCYSVGDEASITISVSGKDSLVQSGSLSVAFTNDGRDKVADSVVFDLSKDNPATVKVSIDFSGFLQILATAKSADGATSKSAIAGAAFDPEKIEPGLPKPDDFDEFWSNGKAEIRKLPLDLQQKKIDELCDEEVDVFSVSFATVNDSRVYGYLCVPKKGDAPYPALVNVPGAGPGVGPDVRYAKQGFVVLNMNVFPYEVPLDAAKRQEMYDQYNKDLGMRYCYFNASDRDSYFFRAAYLGIDRAIDWLAEQDYVDVNRIGYYGTSQGGASALILGGLNEHFCAILSSVPALCDHSGLEKGRSPGWPRIVDFYHGDPQVLEASRYLDAVNFARNINKASIEVTVGFIDGVCSPSSVYAAYNVIPSKNKAILHETGLGHQNGKRYSEAFARLMERVKNNKP